MVKFRNWEGYQLFKDEARQSILDKCRRHKWAAEVQSITPKPREENLGAAGPFFSVRKINLAPWV